jgi:hypothetical protein
MKLIISLLMVVSSSAYAAECSLSEAQSALRHDLFKAAEDGVYDGKVDFCIHGATPEARRQQIEMAVAHLTLNLIPNNQGGDYQVVLCEAEDRRLGIFDIVISDVYCTGTVEHSRYTQD